MNAQMIEKKLCTLEQIPEEYQNAVKKYMAGEYPEGAFTPKESIKDIPTKNGAITLPKIENYVVEWNSIIDGNFIDVDFENSDIFNPNVLNGRAVPIHPQYTIENTDVMCGVDTALSATITNTDFGFKIRIVGEAENVPLGANVLRIDFGVKSDNYEDMMFTIYFCSK